MYTYKSYIKNIKNYILPIIFTLFTISLVIFSNTNLKAAKSGLLLWVNSVIPSLFPFFVATELLSCTNIPCILGRFFNKLMKPIFNVRGEGSFALIMGILSGYPIGAKIACNFRNQNVCSKEECERLLSFTNNSGPLFILGTIGITMFGNSTIGVLLLITHILASFTVGFIFRFWKATKNYTSESSLYLSSKLKNKNISFSNLGEIIGNAITNSISTILMIGGFVVLFSVIISILNYSKITTLIQTLFSPIFYKLSIHVNFISPLFTGLFEITNGINVLSNIPMKNISINIIFTSFLLGIGGISIFLQVFSIVSKSDLSIKPYIIGKLLHGIIAAIYTYIFITIFPFFNFNL